MSLKYKIEYGWCYTDDATNKFKDPFRVSRKDYVFGDKYGDMVQKTLQQFNLPIPEVDEVYRGCSHDLLFLDSHGLVVRIGPQDIRDLMSPTILQPLGWKQHNTPKSIYPVTVSIYPGIELLTKFTDNRAVIDDYRQEYGDLANLIGHANDDRKAENMGLVRVFNDYAIEQHVPVLLDMDSNFNYSSDELEDKRLGIVMDAACETDNQAQITSCVINGLSEGKPVFRNYVRMFEQHQPLRELFWDAAKDVNNPDKSKMECFLDKCAEIVKEPQEMEFNSWEMKNGVLVKSEPKTVNVSLYAPWSKTAASLT